MARGNTGVDDTGQRRGGDGRPLRNGSWGLKRHCDSTTTITRNVLDRF
ncbi:hypothetical protein VXQ18_15850 [Brucella abortus]|nr:hypothetical protein [Brucella abortus]